jgi:hypothetical protein
LNNKNIAFSFLVHQSSSISFSFSIEQTKFLQKNDGNVFGLKDIGD